MSILENSRHIMQSVREYSEEMDVEIADTLDGRRVVVAYNEGGYNFVQIDFEDLRAWIMAHPEGVICE
jgi:hypothetical protein